MTDVFWRSYDASSAPNIAFGIDLVILTSMAIIMILGAIDLIRDQKLR
jgi:hypothetical protein